MSTILATTLFTWYVLGVATFLVTLAENHKVSRRNIIISYSLGGLLGAAALFVQLSNKILEGEYI